MAKKGVYNLKLMQLNAWGGRIDNPLLDFLSEETPDIFCGQEVISYDRGDSILFASLESMKKSMGLLNSEFAPMMSFKYMSGFGRFGNTIMTSSPITKSYADFTNLSYVEDFNFENHDYNIRNFLHVVTNINGKDLNVLTHHGHHVPGHKDGNEQTARQMQQIADYISKLKGPIILTGDFNLTPSSKSLIPIKEQLIDLSDKFGLKTTRNDLTIKSEVCDYIFVSKEITVNNFYAHSKLVSDHQALILEFDI